MSPSDAHANAATSQPHEPQGPSEQTDHDHNDSYKPADRQHAVEYVTNLQAIKKAKDSAAALREQASKITDAKERKRILNDAYNKEIEANGLSKVVQRMQSGSWQGLFAGAGIGGAISAGIGTLVGTLVGGVLSIPTIGLGALVGTGVGAVHGPFIKIGGEEKSWEEADPEDVVQVLEQEQKYNAERSNGRKDSSGTPRRKTPRKLEVRSSSRTQEKSSHDSKTTQTAERRRPRKLERLPRA
jgi:hypothetical protein